MDKAVARRGSILLEREIVLNNLVVAPPKSPLTDSFFSNLSLLILPNLLSSNTPIPFL
jgi:hypothetical protein